jgi:hypothetical protein
MNTTSQKTLIWLGVAMAVIYTLAFVYMMKFWPLPSPSLNAAQVQALYTTNNLEFRFGVVLMVITGAFYLPWAVVMVAQMARIETGFPIWTVLMGLASTLGAWLFAFPPIVWGIAAWLATRSPDLTLLVHQAGFICFVAPACFFPLQIAPIAVIAFSKNNVDKFTPFPRWLGWLTLWTLLLGDLGVMAFVFNSGPFAWNGIFSFYVPLVVFTLWIAAIIYCLLRAIGQQEKAVVTQGRSAAKVNLGASVL